METIDIPSLPVNKHDWVLDLGCGEGRHSIACCFHFPSAQVIGLDLSLQSLQAAINKHSEFLGQHHNGHYIKASGFDLPFPDSRFDHIICSEVLEHIDNYELFLDEIYRVLKPGGLLSVSIPRAWPEKICWALSKEYHQVEGGHVRIFSARTLKQKIIERHFVFLRQHWAHALHSPYWWLRCLWWRAGKENPLSAVYHRLLVWDLLKRPWLTRYIERALNPLMGKSTVFYFRKL